MRFEELAYRADGSAVPFHAGFTVMSLSAEERAAWVARLLGVLEGTRAGDSTSVVYVDRRGQRIGLDRDDQGGATLTDLATGAEVPYSAGHLPLDGRFDWFASMGLTSRAASDLIVVDSEAFTGKQKYDRQDLEAKLSEARKRLSRAESQHKAASTRFGRRDELCRRIADLDDQIRREEAARVRRRHAEAAEAVQRLEAELAIVQGFVPPERTEAEAVLAAAAAADDWWRARGTADDARHAFGSRARLDQDSLTRALARPTEGAEELESLAKACRAMAERRDELVSRLAAGSAAETRRELIEDVEPAYVDALAALADACRPFGVTIDAARIEAAGIGAAGIETLGTEVLAEVASQVEETRDARLQRALEDAEAECHTTRERLEHRLAGLGLPIAGADALVAGAQAVAARADDAAAVLATPLVRRSLEEIEADLQTTRTTLADCPVPDPDEPSGAADETPPDPPVQSSRGATAERTRLLQALRRVERNLPDLAQLAERHSALEREVATLEAKLRAGRPLVSAQQAEMILLRRAAEAGRNDRRREPLPLVLNDALALYGPSDKRRLLDVVARLPETTQLIYLTDDPDTLAWASGQSARGVLTLWRPDDVATVA